LGAGAGRAEGKRLLRVTETLLGPLPVVAGTSSSGGAVEAGLSAFGRTEVLHYWKGLNP
jgi:hypothetical protein